MNKRSLLALLAAIPMLLLTACGGSGGGDGTATIRLVNASPGYASLDMHVGDSVVASDVKFHAASEFHEVKGGSVVTQLTVAGSPTSLLSQTRTLGDKGHYSVVAFGWEGALKSVILSENQEAPAEGHSKVSVLNTAIDAGDVDVYLTAEADSLDASTPLAAGIQGGTQSGYVDVTSATLRLRVTGAGNKADLRLDVSGVVLASGDIGTIILSPGSGGVLVDGLLMLQGSSVTAFLNTKARARVVAGVSDGAAVSISAGGVSLLSTPLSPTIGDYKLINAGSISVTGTVNGVALAPSTHTVAAGSDVTLLVHGIPAASAVAKIVDDNRLPEDAATAKMRLIHAVAELPGGLSLALDFSPIATDIPYPTASAYQAVQAGLSSRVEVTSGATSIFLIEDAVIAPRGVYSVFMMGDSAAPAGILRRER